MESETPVLTEHGPVRAPEIDLPGLVWFNTDRPLSLADLRGRLVILDFWTFCCINCMHIVPTLRGIEEAFPDTVAVIGVHSPKFTAEKDPANVRAAIERYGIVHPVVHDPEFRIWRNYAVRAWPTLMFISPQGHVIGTHSGEPDPELLLDAVGNAVAEFSRHGVVRPGSLPLKAEARSSGRYRFPGKLKALPGGGWVLADAGHNQIVTLDERGGETARYGRGHAGFADGPGDLAAFSGPQGLVASGHAIFVADTGNHAIRRIDRATGHVTTLAGSGRRGPLLQDSDEARTVVLASPWDLELRGMRLFFANAGTHQLGEVDLRTGALKRLAGSGAEGLRDGAALGAHLAQPSGLALDAAGTRLYFVDSETSAVRVVTLEGDSRVETLVGTGLFDFGHRNGSLAGAQFQHPLGLAWRSKGDEGELLVADSYNSRARAIDLTRRAVHDFGADFVCMDPICLPVGEPAGIAMAGTRVLVVDTNNHRVLEYDSVGRTYRTWAR